MLAPKGAEKQAEAFVQVWWDPVGRCYHLHVPEQEVSAGGVHTKEHGYPDADTHLLVIWPDLADSPWFSLPLNLRSDSPPPVRTDYVLTT